MIISPIYCVVGEFALNEIARATLQQYGIVQLSSATNSDSETEAATSKAVKTAYDKAVEAKTTVDGKVGLNGNESINGEKSFENRIVAKRNIRISDSPHYVSRGDYLNIGANNGDCWFEYKSTNREIGTLRMHANGNLTYKRQKIYHAGAKPQFNTDIEGKPNTLAGYGIGNFKVEEFRGNLNELKTDGIYAITQASRSQNLPVSTSCHIQVIAGNDGAWCRQLAYVAYSTDMYERHQTSQAEDNWSTWVKLNDIEPVRELLSTKANISHTHNPRGQSNRLLSSFHESNNVEIGLCYQSSNTQCQFTYSQNYVYISESTLHITAIGRWKGEPYQRIVTDVPTAEEVNSEANQNPSPSPRSGNRECVRRRLDGSVVEHYYRPSAGGLAKSLTYDRDRDD
ncbi:hypothetical protein TA8730_13500 [Haemophilus influenzae]|nr:hypothetical protein TA8730_13500 [Haemophilus influenzae]